MLLTLALLLSLAHVGDTQREGADELPPFPIHLFSPPSDGSGVVPLVDWASHLKLRLDSQFAGRGAKLAVHVWVDDGQRVAWTPGELADIYHFVDTVSHTTVQSVSVLCDGSFVLEAPDEGVEVSCGSMEGTSFYMERALPGASWCSTNPSSLASSPRLSFRDCDFVWVEDVVEESSDRLFDAKCDVSVQAIGSQFVALTQYDLPWLRDVHVEHVAAVAIGSHSRGVASLAATGSSAAPHLDLWSPACYASAYGDESWSVRTDGIPSIWNAPANLGCERATSCEACAALDQCTWCSGGDGSCSTFSSCFGGVPFNVPEYCPTVAMPSPTLPPTYPPSPFPTLNPTPIPSHHPTTRPTRQPTLHPTANPSPNPTFPTPKPAFPTPKPTPMPSRNPTLNPTSMPMTVPTRVPTAKPTSNPTLHPTLSPTAHPTPVSTHAPCSYMNRTISYERSEALRSTDAATASACITCIVICTSEGAQLSDTSDNSCDSLFDTGGLFLGRCSTGDGGGGGWTRPGSGRPEQKRKDVSTCALISAALWPASNLTVNVHPADTEVTLYTSEIGGISPGGSIAVKGASALRLNGVYQAMNVSVESGVTIIVDAAASIQGKVHLASTADAMVPPVFRVGSELEFDGQGALSLDGFGSFELAGAGRLVVGDRERADDALVHVIRREPSSATLIELDGTVVWDRPENENVLLVASVRQIGSGSISHATFGGVFADSLNNTLVPMEVNGTGDEVHVALMYGASGGLSVGTPADSGRGSQAQSVKEGDNSTALIVTVVVLVLCLLLCLVVVIRRKRNDETAGTIKPTTVPGRAAQYYEPEMLQSQLVGVRVMGAAEDVPQTRVRRSSSRYFKPVAAPKDTYYKAPIVNRRAEHGYGAVASDQSTRSRQSSLSRIRSGHDTHGQYGSVPKGLPGNQGPPPPPPPADLP
jgi:hypothetical protein